MGEWKNCMLGDIITFQRGHDLPREKMINGDYPVVGSNGIIGYHNEYTTDAPCVSVGRSGNVGNPHISYVPSWAHNTTLYIKEYKDSDPEYVYYLLKTLDLGNFAGGSAVPTLNRNHIHNLPVYIPPIPTQRTIAATLSALDDKIALNNHISRNLEQMAQTIFKSWFVDFEPWGGVMPEDWSVEKLGNLCQSISKTHSFDKENLAFLNTGDIDNGLFLHSDYSPIRGMPGQAKKSIQQGDILYSEIRPINKHFAFVNFDSTDYVVSTKLMVIRAKGIDSRRLYHYLTSNDVIAELQLEAESRSGTFPQIRFENIQSMDIVIATPEIERTFTSFLHGVYTQIDANNLVSARLAAIRDALLPKLMSGELSAING